MVVWIKTKEQPRREVGRGEASKQKPQALGGARPYDIHRDDAYYVSSHQTFESAVLKANREIMKWRTGSILTVHIDYESQRPNAFEHYVVLQDKADFERLISSANSPRLQGLTTVTVAA